MTSEGEKGSTRPKGNELAVSSDLYVAASLQSSRTWNSFHIDNAARAKIDPIESAPPSIQPSIYYSLPSLPPSPSPLSGVRLRPSLVRHLRRFPRTIANNFWRRMFIFLSFTSEGSKRHEREGERERGRARDGQVRARAAPSWKRTSNGNDRGRKVAGRASTSA